MLQKYVSQSLLGKDTDIVGYQQKNYDQIIAINQYENSTNNTKLKQSQSAKLLPNKSANKQSYGKSNIIIENFFDRNKQLQDRKNNHQNSKIFQTQNPNSIAFQSRKDHISELLNQEYTSYRNQIQKKRKYDHVRTQDTQRTEAVNESKYFGKNNSTVDQIYQAQAHRDLQLRQNKSQELKQQKKMEDYQYIKKLQDRSLKTLEKAKIFRKYFNDVHDYLDSNHLQFKANIEPVQSKRQKQEKDFVEKRIRHDHIDNFKRSIQKSEELKKEKQLLINDLKRQMEYNEKLKNRQRMARIDYNNVVNIKDVRSFRMNPQALSIHNPQITNIFHRRYARNQKNE